MMFDLNFNAWFKRKFNSAIIERLEQKNFDSPQERNEFWKKIWKNNLTQKYRRPDHLDFWLWNDDFFISEIIFTEIKKL